jgi:hypothetical protein
MPAAKYKVLAVGPQVAATATAPVYVTIAGVGKKALPGQPYIVANELVCSNIARALLLPCPPGALMESGDDTYFFSLDFNLAGQSLPSVTPATIVQDFPALSCGIIVCAKAARFIGEREDGTIDARKLGNKFTFPNVYTQWRTYWKREMNAGVEKLAQAKTANYFVELGGEVNEAGGDSADEVCTFLCHLLVGGGALDAYRWNVDEDGNVTLAAEIATTLDRLQLLANERESFARHPVVKEQPVSGHHVTHTPSFSQRNGRLYVFDHIDLNGTRPTKIKERAGLLGYMFSDIRAAENDLQAYSLVRPSADNGSDAIDYAKKVLGSESSIVNWLDENARDAFLEERRKVADAA